MLRNILIAIACVISTIAFAQERGKGNPALEKWRACADAAAKRYSKSAEALPWSRAMPSCLAMTRRRQLLKH